MGIEAQQLRALNQAIRKLDELMGAGGPYVFAGTDAIDLTGLRARRIQILSDAVIEELEVNGADVLAAGEATNGGPFNYDGVTLPQWFIFSCEDNEFFTKIHLTSGSVAVYPARKYT